MTVKKTQLHDICELKDRIRAEHCNEISATSGRTAEQSLLVGYLSSSQCYTASLYIGMRSIPVHMFGVTSDNKDPEKATVWALGSREVDRVPRQFCFFANEFISHFLNDYKTIYNWIDARYERGIRFLKFLGAHFEEAQPYGVENRLFHYFEFRRS